MCKSTTHLRNVWIWAEIHVSKRSVEYPIFPSPSKFVKSAYQVLKTDLLKFLYWARLKEEGEASRKLKFIIFVSRSSWEDARNLVRAKHFAGPAHVAQSSCTKQRQLESTEEVWSRGRKRVKVYYNNEGNWSMDKRGALPFPWGSQALR